MKRVRLAIAIGFGAAILGPGPAFPRAESLPEAKQTAPKLQLTRREPERLELGNGIRVWHLQNDRLPLVSIRAVIRTGAIWEPADKQGIADLTGRMLRRGGTTKRSADEIDEELDFLAAQLGASIGDEQGNVTLNVLTANLDAALAIFADLLMHPAFDESKLAIQKNLIKEQIRRQNDDPIQVAVREFGKLVWGADHPRARTPTEESVDALSRDDVVDFHARFFRPGNVLLGVAGDVSKKDIKAKLEKALGGWKGQPLAFPDVPPAPAVEPRAAFAEKALPQSTVLIGHLGPRETDPHRASGQVMMNILGQGGFTSYIVDRVRNDEGLAYVAGGFLGFGEMDAGTFITYALSKTETTCRAAELIVEQIERIQTVPVTEEELVRARDGILNSEAFEYETGEQIVANLMDLVYFGLPPDHDQKTIEHVGEVTAADVQEAAIALMDRKRLTILAVGNPDGLDCEWRRFAEQLGVELREIDLE
jgi:predicted Zn-dependent peptidase